MMSGLSKENILFNIEPDPLFFDSDYVPTPPGEPVPINVPDYGGLGPAHVEELLEEQPPQPQDPPPDCNLCHDVVLIPAWD
jgi:hypothetical protein